MNFAALMYYVISTYCVVNVQFFGGSQYTCTSMSQVYQAIPELLYAVIICIAGLLTSHAKFSIEWILYAVCANHSQDELISVFHIHQENVSLRAFSFNCVGITLHLAHWKCPLELLYTTAYVHQFVCASSCVCQIL